MKVKEEGENEQSGYIRAITMELEGKVEDKNVENNNKWYCQEYEDLMDDYLNDDLEMTMVSEGKNEEMKLTS